MKIATMTQIVDDDFERGMCYKCPFCADECIAMWRYDECALKIDKAIDNTVPMHRLLGEIDAMKFIITRAQKRIEYCENCIGELCRNTEVNE